MWCQPSAWQGGACQRLGQIGVNLDCLTFRPLVRTLPKLPQLLPYPSPVETRALALGMAGSPQCARWPEGRICDNHWTWIVFLNSWAAMEKTPALEDEDVPRPT